MTLHKSLETYYHQYDFSIENPEEYWRKVANTFVWRKPFTEVLNWDKEESKIEWFKDGYLNITENCIDRHLENKGNQTAFIWESNTPEEPSKSFTYKELLVEVCKIANGLKNLGVQKGDRVCLYMPLIPELAFSILACARIGAVHSVVFAGFSARSLAERIQDAKCKILITADVGLRGSKQIELREIADLAVAECPSVEKVVYYQRSINTPEINDSKQITWADFLKGASDWCAPEEMNAEDPLFILYTSGSTGKPKGLLHTCGGYMVYTASTFSLVFQYRENELFWCTADIGWITGHSYLVYGPLLNGAKILLFEGVPTWPDPGRFWEIIEKYQVNIFYTAPTAIRALEKEGDQWPAKYNLKSLRVLGTVGEPINEEAWHWYDTHIGKNRCPIVDTWWQTETGGIMISPIAGIIPAKPGFATLPLPGIIPCILDEKGNVLTENVSEGNLCIAYPWPSIARTIYGDHDRYKKTYFGIYPGYYFTGDGCKRDPDGYYRITGRVDDVINVSGHRLGTAEIESALNEHEYITESAVVGYPHEIKGQGIYAFVISSKTVENQELLKSEINDLVRHIIGPLAKPDKIQVVSSLPKTRSGKIMRRILRKIAENELDNLGDTSTLLDPACVDEIIEGRIQ